MVVATPASKNITSAFSEWATRPAEQRFKTLDDMRTACRLRTEQSIEIGPVNLQDMEAIPAMGGVAIANSEGGALLNNHTFNQLSNSIGAPAGYLRTLDNDLAAQCLNAGLEKYPERERNLFVIQGTEEGQDYLSARAITSPQYSRYHDHQVVTDLADALSLDGWQVPPCRPYPGCPEADTWIATEADCLPGNTFALSIRPGDKVGPGGLYSSDKDSFVFLVNQHQVIKTPGGEMYRAVIVQNSEVGAASFKIDCFWYSAVCGNHILWGAEEVASVRIVHRGQDNNARINAQSAMHAAIRSAELASAGNTEHAIAAAADTPLTFAEVAQRTGLSKTIVKAGEIMQTEYPQDHGDRAGSAWGWVQGLTRASQHSNYAADRVQVDQAAAKILQPFKERAGQYAIA
jgi:hypothetical protein